MAVFFDSGSKVVVVSLAGVKGFHLFTGVLLLLLLLDGVAAAAAATFSASAESELGRNSLSPNSKRSLSEPRLSQPLARCWPLWPVSQEAEHRS